MTAPGAGDLALRIRRHVLRMAHASRGSHVASGLSVADILAVLLGEVLRLDPARPDWPERDRFILSKGHAAAALYAVLAEMGFFSVARLADFQAEGADLLGHASHDVPGVEFSTGSLGHGLSVGAGMALFAKRTGAAWRTVVVLGDGEMNEGSNWEAMMFAAHHGLDNLSAVMDTNKIQGFGNTGEVLDLEPLADKWRAFGWAVDEVDGHDLDALRRSLAAQGAGTPRAVIAHTVKGKGVGFMENDLLWHYRPPDDAELARALAELEQPG
jgi:transketolase